ncbi:MAG: glutaredoxin family protein [Candidatus Dormiibacterota bacterium]
MHLVLVTRQGCHLCDDALKALHELGLEPELVDVDANEALHAIYDCRVPVVLVDDRVVAEGRVEGALLRRALGRS